MIISVFGYENEKKYPVYTSKTILRDMLIYYLKKMKVKRFMSLLKILIDLCTIKHYPTIENISVAIAYRILVVQKC